jgi:hypothetical protein
MPDQSPGMPVGQSAPTGSAAANSPVQLQPSIRLPLLGVKDGGISWPEVAFNRASDRVLVADVYTRFWSWSNARWHAPDLALACVLLALAWAARRAWSNFRARNEASLVGRWLCARCRYDLTPPGTDLAVRTRPRGIAPLCPECGSHTAKRPPRQVRSRARRMFAPIATLLLVCGGATWVFHQTLELAPGSPWPSTLWPTPWLSAILPRFFPIPVLQRAGVTPSATLDTHMLTMYELPSGRALGSVGGLKGIEPRYEFTTDESWCVAVAQSYTDVPHVSAVDLRSTRFKAYQWPMPGPGQCWIMPGSHDAHAVLFEELARADGMPWWNLDRTMTAPTRDIVIKGWSLNIETGRLKSIFEIPITLDKQANYRSIALAAWKNAPSGDPVDFTAVLQTSGRDRQATSSSFRIFSITSHGVIESRTEYPGSCNIDYFPPTGSTSLTLFVPAVSGQSTALLNIRTGAITPASPGLTWTTPDGLLTTTPYGTSPPGFRAPDGTLVAETYLGSLPIQSRPNLQGRYAWCNWQGDPPPQWLVNLLGYRFRRDEFVAIWDLDPVKRSVRDRGKAPPGPDPQSAPKP